MKIGSLFSGIGGLELGLERAGVGHTVWQVEREPFCRQVLARHWPDAIRYEDVTTVDWSSVEPVEVLCGGFPCQDVSYAGTGAGLDGQRSGLWWEFLRAIRVVRPRHVVVENVGALLVRGMGAVVGGLAESGYSVEWSVVSACAMGAPHTRERVFLLAHSDGVRREASRPDGGRDGASLAQRRVDSEHVPAPALVGDGEGRPDGWWSTEPAVGRVADGVSPGLDRSRLRALGNAVVPQVAEVVGHRLLEIDAALPYVRRQT